MMYTLFKRLESPLLAILGRLNHPQVHVIKEAFQDLIIPLSLAGLLNWLLQLGWLSPSNLIWQTLHQWTLGSFLFWLALSLNLRLLQASTLPVFIYLTSLMSGFILIYQSPHVTVVYLPMVIFTSLLNFYALRWFHHFLTRLMHRLPGFHATVLVPLLSALGSLLLSSILAQGVLQIASNPGWMVHMLSLLNTWPILILVNSLIVMFWTMGYHGTNLLAIVLLPLGFYGLISHLNGSQIPLVFAGYAHIIFGNWTVYFALLTLCYGFMRSRKLRSIAKQSAPSTLFNINEHLIFSLQVNNAKLFTPILTASLVNLLTYAFALSSGWIKPFIYLTPFTLPLPLQVLWGTQSLSSFVLWMVLLGVNLVVLYPAMRSIDRQAQIDELKFRA